MKYYIIDGRILDFEKELDKALYTYEPLSESQTDFYLLNPYVSIEEILNEELIAPEVLNDTEIPEEVLSEEPS